MRNKLTELLTSDTLLLGIYWIFWIALFALAAGQLLYFAGYGDFATALSLALPAAAFKYFVGTLSSGKTVEDDRQLQFYRSFIKNALAWSGPTVFQVNDTRQLDDGLAFGTVIDSTVGFEVYNSDVTSGYSGNVVREVLPSEVYEYLGHVKELEKIDRCLKFVARRMGPGDNDSLLLHDFRTVILRAVFDLTKADKDAFEEEFAAALQVLFFKAHNTPPIRNLIAATKVEYERTDSRRIQVGDWRVTSSWIKSVPPKTFDDLLGETGLSMPVPPKENFQIYDG
uniref:Uncharacterized protein n=1 Tax=Rhizobium leguminosarum TaxID=384 RepID=A0A179BYP6_RHILE|nr:hypothetical protein [Rhizobium leguminosarum]OAP96842.1 hypothetical protein A4U53_37405 [Rhizobium leguminosarum]